jgi:hypothetical protein
MKGSETMNLTIVLPLRNQVELTGLLERLYDPSSADYHKFLSVEEFTEEFGPTADDFQRVVSYAQSNGFTVTDQPANRLIVPMRGTVEQINRAFHLSMNLYRHPTEERSFFSPDREPSLDLAVPVQHIAGLNNFSLPQPMVVRPVEGQTVANVLGSGPGGSYLGSDMRAAYYGGTTLTGTGQAVGLLEFGGYDQSDVDATFTNAGQSTSVAINNVLLDGAIATNTYDAEQVLDIVQAIGMAPGLSQVRVYIGVGGASSTDDASIFNSMATENIAKQLSCSWGWIPDDPETDDVFFQEFAAQGQSLFVASGDNGAFDAAVSPFFYPSEDQYVTSVGGTHLTTTGAAGPWASEFAWNSIEPGTTAYFGSGGGISPDGIALPSWQAGAANSANGGSATLRNEPDVAMEGDFDNYNCAGNSCSGDMAGTSFAAPRWAGFMALVNQQAVEAGNAPAGGVGFVNPALYAIGAGSSYSTELHDITSGNNDTANQPVWFSAVTGYDLVTGWGSPAGQPLIDALAGPQVPGFWIASSQGTLGILQGATGTTTITVTDAGGFTGNVSLNITSTLPAGVTAAWGTNPTSGTSVLTFTVSQSATPGNYPVAITGTSGNLTASSSFTLAVHGPSFTLSASYGNLSLNQGGTANTTITVNDQYGFTGNVNLAVTSTLPAGVTASWGTNPTSGTSVLTLTATSSAAPGTTAVTITGTSGNLSATTTVSVTVYAPNFTLSYGGGLSIGQGSSATGYVYVNDEYGFTGNVSLSISGLPSGVTATWSQNPTTYNSTLTLTAASSVPTGPFTATITGTSGSLTATTTATFTVYAPTFTLSGGYSLNIGQGSSGTTYIYVNDEYGFNGSVNLSVTGLPSGVTATWSQNPTTYSSMLTLTASSSAPTGQYTVTVTGTSGSISATTTVTLGVFVPTFTLYGGGTVNVGQGSSGTSYIYVNDQYGFNGSVKMSVAGLPTGVTASWSPNPTTSSTTLTLTATTAAPVGQYSLTITGTSGSISATTNVTLAVYVPTFTLYGGGGLNLGQGTSGTTYVDVNPEYGFTGSVNLSVTGLPSGVTASFSPNPTNGNSTLTLTAASNATLGQYNLTVTGTSGTQTATTTVTVGVYVPTFTLSDYSSVSIGQGSSGTSYVYVNPQYGFTGSVNLSVSGLPSGVTASWSPNPTTGSSQLTLTATSTAALGQYTLTITGTSGNQTATSTLTLGVYQPTFTLNDYGSVTLGQGTTGSSYVSINSQYGFSGGVSLAVTGLPSGVTASFSPNPSSAGSSQLILTASSTAALGQYTLTITGTSGSQTASTTLSLGVYVPTFTLNDYSSVTIGQGSSGTNYVYIASNYGFNGNVSLSVSGLPNGVTAAFSPNPVSAGSSLLTLTASSTAATGQFPLTITGTSGSQSATAPLTLTVVAPSFTLYGGGSLSLNQGATGTSNIYVNPQYGFTGAVTLSASGLPSGVTASFSPNPTSTQQSVMTLVASSSATPGLATITINGNSGSTSSTTTLNLTINASTFTLQDAPSELQLQQSGSARSTVSIIPQNGFTGSVGLAVSGLPSGVTATWSTNQTTTNAVLTLTAGSSATAGTATATITGTSGALTVTAPLTLTVASAPTATATTLAVTSSGSPVSTVAYGSMVTLTATVSAGSTAVKAGLVKFCDATATYCEDIHILGTAQLTSAGTAVLNLVPSTGSHSYQAVFTGTTGVAASTSAASALNVPGSVASITTLAQSGAAGNYTLTATVSGPGTAAPTGTVSFLDTNSSNAVLGTGALGQEQATLSWLNPQSPGTGFYPYSVVVGDFNGDGIPDLAVANQDSNTVTILLGKGDGTFTATAVNPSTGYYPTSIAVADLNGDGKLDLAVANSNSGSVTILLGNGDGTFTASPSSPGTGGSPNSIAVGDFNGDGIPDLAVANFYGNSVTILLGDGDGTFTQAASPAVIGTPNFVAVGDFNGDGIQDLAVVNSSNNTVAVLLGNGDGTFSPTASPSTGSWPWGVAVGDFNGDGIPDLAVTNRTGSSVTILLGNGDGTFTPAAPAAAIGPSGIAIGDFNGDGKLDLAITDYFGENLTILLGNGDGTFSASSTSPQTGNEPWSIAVADFNGDGKPDIAVANEFSATTTILTNQLSWTATASASSISPLGSGQHLVDASYPGDGGYNSSLSPTTSLTAGKGTPTVIWSTPAAIPYGTPLSATQLDATASVPGTFSYTPALGAVLTAGPQTLTVNFTPTDTTSYNSASATVTLTVNPATPTINWPIPASVPVGTALGSAQLNAASTVPGVFVYNPPAGTVITSAANVTLSVTFTPTDTTDYNPATTTVTLAVNQATPTINWPTPTAISYGTALSATQLDATASVAGSFSYTPALGTVLTAGPQTLSVNFTPTDTADYGGASASVTLTVNKVTPTITWNAPGVVPVGTALSATQLNATASVPGSFAYTPAAGTVLSIAGNTTLSAIFTPTDATDYNTATATVTQTVLKATPTISWSAPSAISYGTALSATQLNATASVPGTLTYSPPLGTVLTAGAQTLVANFTPTDAADYNGASATVTLTVNKATPTITWNTPAAVNVGATLGAAQLNATASVPGAFAYNPAAGTVLSAGGTTTLTATFTPTDTTDYNTASDTVNLIVNRFTPSLTVTPSVTSVTNAQALTVTVAVAGGSGNPTPTGSVTLSGGSYSGAAATLSNGSVTFNIAPNALPLGADTLTATYTPDSVSAPTYNSATGASPAVTVTAQPLSSPTVTASATAAVITNLQADTVNITVAVGAGQPTPTGIVTLSSGSYSAQQTLASGAASFTLPAGTLPSGANTLTASYAGDLYYSAGTATTLVTVSPAVVNVTTPTGVNPGSSTTATANFLSGSDYAGTLNLICTLTGSPTVAVSLPTCTANPTSVPLVSSGSGSSTLTIHTTAASNSAMNRPAGLNPWRFGGAVLAALVCFGLPSRRRRWITMTVLLFALLTAGAIGCGGGGGSSGSSGTGPSTPATTAGTYTFTLTATDSANAKIATSASFTVAVE